MAPAADVRYSAVTYADDGGRERYGYSMVPRETPGVGVHDDWDALGMRASGSHSVSFDNVRLPLSALAAASPSGTRVEYWSGTSPPGSSTQPPRSGSRERARERRRRTRASQELDPHTQMLACGEPRRTADTCEGVVIAGGTHDF